MIISISLSIAYYRKVWNPIFVFEIMLFLGIIFSFRELDFQLIDNGIFWILLGTFIFIGSFLTCQMLLSRKRKQQIDTFYNWKTIDSMLTANVFISIASLAISVYTILQITANLNDLFTKGTYIRMLYLERETNPVITAISLFLSFNFYTTFCLFPLALREKRKHSGTKLIIVLVLRLLSSLVTMSKEAFLIDLIVFVSAYSLVLRDEREEKVFFRKYAVPFIILIAALLIVVSIQRNYIGQGRYHSYGEAVIGTIRSYVAAPVMAFCQLLGVSNIHFTNGQLCFRPILNILSYLGIGSRVSIIQEAIAGSANVYTVFGNMYRDFSYLGILLLSIVFGAFLGLIYNTNYKYRLSNIVANSIVMMTMFFGYYDLQIIQTVYLFVMLYAVLFDRVFKSRIYITE